MSQCELPQHVHLCFTDDAAVFLDLERDRYIGLDGVQLSTLRAALESSNGNNTKSRELIAELQEGGLLARHSMAGRNPSPVSIESAKAVLVDVDTDTRANVESRVRAHHVRSLLISYALATLNFRWGSLARTVRRVRSIKRRDNESIRFDFDTARDAVRIFQRIRPLLYASHNRCLFDSLVLMEFLARYRLYPTWILGVRTGPFAAHAWVQKGSFIFNDSPAHTGSYTPILVI